MYAYVLLCISAGRHLAILYGLTLLFSVVLLVLLLWCLQHPGAGLVLVPVGGWVRGLRLRVSDGVGVG